MEEPAGREREALRDAETALRRDAAREARLDAARPEAARQQWDAEPVWTPQVGQSQQEEEQLAWEQAD